MVASVSAWSSATFTTAVLLSAMVYVFNVC